MSKLRENVRKIPHITAEMALFRHSPKIQKSGKKAVVVPFFKQKKEAEQLCSCPAGSFRSLTDFV